MILRLENSLRRHHSPQPMEMRRQQQQQQQRSSGRKRRRVASHTGLLYGYVIATTFLLLQSARAEENPSENDPAARSFFARRLPPPLSHGGPLSNRLSLPVRLIPSSRPPPSSIKHDLHPSAQTLYDLRGFHIPLGGQEETQRYLRQQNELEQAQRSKPLVFPSFFQPQSPAYQQQQEPPHSLNIFGHNQHHQQRYVLGGPPQQPVDTTFRPSQPDLSLPSTTEPFKPVQSPQQQHANEIKDEKDDFVYVYDYEEEPPQQQRELDKLRPSPSPSPQIRANQPTAVVIESTPSPHERPQQHDRPQPQQLLNQNHFEVDSRRVQPLNQNFYHQYQQSQIEASPLPPRHPHGPRVEIVPSSERKPPPDQSNAIQTNLREVVHQQQPKFLDEPAGKGVQNHLNEFKPSIRFLPPPPPTQFSRPQQNFVSDPFFGRSKPPQQRPYVLGHDYNGQIVQQELPKYTLQEFIQDPLPDNIKYEPAPVRDLLHPPPSQKLQPVTSVFPQRFVEPSRPTYLIEEQAPDLIEVYREQTTTTERPTTTPGTTTLRPFRRNPFPPRHRLQPATTTTEATTTAAAPAPRGRRPRPIRPRTTTPAPIEDLSENYVLLEEDEEEDIGRIKSYEEGVVRRVPQQQQARVVSTAAPAIIRRPQQQQQQQFIDEEEVTSLRPSFIDDHLPQQELIIIQQTPAPPTRSPFIHHQTATVQGQGLQERVPSRGRFIGSGPRLIHPPVKSTGKPLYPSASDKEGGLYSDYLIPIGHVYGSPIPFLPINQVLERMPGLYQEEGGQFQLGGRGSTRSPPVFKSSTTVEKHVGSRGRGQQQQHVAPRIRNPVTRQTTTTTTTTTTPRPTTYTPRTTPFQHQQQQQQPFRSLRTNTQGSPSSTASAPAPSIESDQPRRRRIRPRVEPSPTAPATAPAPRFIPKPTTPARNNPTLRSTVPLPPSLEVSLPRTPKPNPLKRRVKFRVTTTSSTTTTSTTTTTTTPAPPPTESTSIEYEDPPAPKPRRKVIKKHRPTTTTLRSFPQSRQADEDEESHEEEDEDEESPPVRVLKRPHDRFSSKYREETRPLEVVEITPTPAEPSQLPIRLTKPKKLIKVVSTTRRTTTTTPEPPPQPQNEVLPSSVLLRPKDVLQNRKPARRIPPGSASDKLKALQERRRNLLRGKQQSPSRAPPAKTTAATRKRLEEPVSLEVVEDEEEDEDYSDAEPSKREISAKSSVNSHLLRHSSLFKQRPKKTEPTSEEAEAVLKIPTKSPLSIVEWFRPGNSKEEPSQAESVQVEEATTAAAAATGQDPASRRTVVTMSPSFNSMSTNEPSLPLEAYFPILSGGSSREQRSS